MLYIMELFKTKKGNKCVIILRKGLANRRFLCYNTIEKCV